MKKGLVLLSACLAVGATSSALAGEDTTYEESQLVLPAKPAKKVAAQPKKYKDKQATPAATEEEKTWIDNFSATMTMTTNYVFRGMTQTSNLPAVQGGLTYTFPIGLYLNAWASNVKFPGTDATIEVDTVAGWSGEKGDFAYNLNIARYNYPGYRFFNYNEFNSVFNYSFIQAALSYSANVYNTHQSGTYYNAGINYDVPAKYVFNIENVNFQALMGHYSLPRAAGNSYNDYLVALSKTIKNYTLTAQWTGTNGRQHNSPYDDNQIVGTLNVAIPA